MIFLRTLLLTALATILLSAGPSSAQETLPFLKKDKVLGIGIHFSIYDYGENIIMSLPQRTKDFLIFPMFGVNVQYNAYQGIISPALGDNNESLLRLTGRYNLEMGKKFNSKVKEYLYGGIDLWYYNNKISSTANSPDRPFDQSINLGFNGGLGVELGPQVLRLSMEIGAVITICREVYEDFICGWRGDLRVGLHSYF